MDGTIAALLDRAERIASMPARHAVPALVAGTALQVAVLGRAAREPARATTKLRRAWSPPAAPV